MEPWDETHPFLRLTKKLERSLRRLPEDLKFWSNDIKGAIDELKMIVDFTRNAKLEEGSRLIYFISDLFVLAQDLLDFNENMKLYYDEIRYMLFWLHKVKKHVLRFKAEEAVEAEHSTRSEDAGEGDNGCGEDVVVGFEEDLELLLKEAILNEATHFETCHIFGMVGIGKTTFARQVYNHASVVARFDRRAWICASGDLSYMELLMQLIEQVADCEGSQRDLLLEEMKSDGPRYLQLRLRQFLQKKSYLIVVDDIHQKMTLKPILRGLPREGKGCRLVATSRSQFIQPRADSGHEMKPLDSNDSWRLFMKTIFRGNEEFPKQLEKMMRDILLTQCGGVPLAIKEVGRQMAEKRRSGIEWEELLDSIDFDSTLHLLESSYQDLEPEVQLSFLHLAFFKENIILRHEKLIQIWAAAGMFLIPWPDYALSLYLASMIDMEPNTMVSLKDLQVNPILHKLSIKKAEKERGFEILSSNGNSRPSQTPCHRVIRCSRKKFNYSMNQNKHLVSLFFHGGGYFDVNPSYWESLELLRILDWEDFGLRILPEGIEALMELRYLGLRNNYIEKLPNSLGELKKLEVLDMDQNFMVEVPDIIWEMVSIRQIFMSDVICREPLKIETLQNLKILTYISVDNWIYKPSSLQVMTSLSKLGIEEVDGNLDVSKLFTSLAELQNLNHLILRGFRFKRMPCLDQLGTLHNVTKLKLDGLLARLPDASNFPPNIEYLVLVNSHLDEDPMPVLEKLSKLTHLKLRNAYNGRQMKIMQNKFQRLRDLYIEELRNLRNVQVGKGAMLGLRTFRIKNCTHLEALPEEIGSMNHMTEFKMVTTKKIARKILPSFGSKIQEVEINPVGLLTGSVTVMRN